MKEPILGWYDLDSGPSSESPPGRRLLTRVFPLGVFALVVIGVHAGADQLDEHLFLILNLIDRGLDAAMTWTVESIGSLIGAGQGAIEAMTLNAVGLIDLSTKIAIARWLALIAELLVILVLALFFAEPLLTLVEHSLGARVQAKATIFSSARDSSTRAPYCPASPRAHTASTAAILGMGLVIVDTSVFPVRPAGAVYQSL